MGRTASQSTVLTQPALIGPNEAAAIDAKAAQAGAMATADQLAGQVIDGCAEALQMVGRIEALDWVATVATSQIARAYLTLKETKAYVGYPYTDSDGRRRRVATLDEFCALRMPVSAKRCREIAANYRTVGEALYETTERMGFREQDYRAIRALPTEDHEAFLLVVRQAAETGDEDAVLSVLAELVARHKAAREAAEDKARVFEGERDEARRDYEAASALLGQSKAKIRRMEGGDLRPLRLDEQMAQWPAGCGVLIGEIRRHLTQIGLIIQSAEQLPIPDQGTPEADIHSRAMRLLFDSLSAPLNDLSGEVLGVENHLNRIVGAFAYPADDAPVQGAF